MAQSMFGGMTSYKGQSLNDIQQDINKWQTYTNETQNFFNETIEKLEEMNYMEKIDFDVREIFQDTVRITNAFLEDFKIINENISNRNITKQDVKLLDNIGDVSITNNRNYRIFKKGNWHEYEKTDPNSDFRLAEKLYENGRDFFVTLQDAANAAKRLEDYINPSPQPTGNSYIISGTGHNIIQGQSGNMTMNIQQNFSTNIKEIKEIIEEIRENLDNYFNDAETKENVKEYLEVLETEIEKEKPKKSMMKTALEGLQVFNESTKFISSVAQLTQEFLPLITQ